MTTTATEVRHEPWCTKHVNGTPSEGTEGWCESRSVTHNVEIGLLTNVDGLNRDVGIEIYSADDNYLTAAQAREVAAELVRASMLTEGRRGHSATANVAANLVRLVSERQPMDVNDIERLARVLGVTVTELFAD
jgi:hypothetical protein